MSGKREATVDDLRHVEGKAEIVNGEIVRLPFSTGLHGSVRIRIAASLMGYEQRTKPGRTLGGTVAFIVNLPNRRSFSPDVAFVLQPPTDDFVDGAPVFAVEVRSNEDYGPEADHTIAAKRADYFAAGTLVVWDVDFMHDEVIRVFRASDPETPTVYHRGEHAEAEPAVPGWSMPVDELFKD